MIGRQFSDADLARARSRWDVVAADVPMKRQGRELAGLCPFHTEKSPSFYINADKGFFHCFGCGAHGTTIDYVMRVRGLDFIAAMRELLDLPAQRPKDAAPIARQSAPEADRDTAAEIDRILAGCGVVSERTPAWLYLWSRSLDPRQPELLAHPALYCHEIRAPLPAIVAPIRDRDGTVTAVQRIWVSRTLETAGGVGPKDSRAKLSTRKKTLGVMGDGAVRLAPAERYLGIAEGVETAIAACAEFRFPVWAVCGVHRLGFPGHWRHSVGAGEQPDLWIDPATPPRDVEARHVDERPPAVWIPGDVERLFIFGDNGDTGRTIGEFAADWYAWRYRIQAEAIFPAPQFGDWNDQLIAEGRR